MFIFAILGEIKLLYFIIPICFYGMYVLINKFSIYHVVILFFIYWGFVPIMEKAMSLYYDKEYVNQVFTKEYIEDQTTNNYGFADGGFNRSTALSLTSTVILKTPLKLCIGNGIGSGSASNIFGGSIYHAYQYTTYNYFATSYILVETGWIGFILFCLIFLILLYRFYYYYKHYDDIVIKYWASCGIMGAFITYPLMWYSNCPYYDYYLFYILWALCFLSISYRLAYLKNKEK